MLYEVITRPPEAPRVIAGDIRFNGESILKTHADSVVKHLKLALVPEGRHIFGNLTVQENLELATYSRSKQDDLKQDYQKIFRITSYNVCYTKLLRAAFLPGRQ